MLDPVLQDVLHEVDHIPVDMTYGRVVRTLGLSIEADGPAARLGEICHILVEDPIAGRREYPAEVVAFQGDRVVLMPFTEIRGLAPGALVRGTGRELTVPVGRALLGRVLDALGRPIDGKGPIDTGMTVRVAADPPDPIRRPMIQQVLPIGVRAIDSLLTCGRGQRIGIFAGSGVGKSTLLGMAVRGTAADVCVVALIGERGREVREFLENDLGEEGLAKSVVVVVPSSDSPLLRVKGAFTAVSLAEHFRDAGLDVLFVMDSLTRLCMARREIGLAIGEPPTTRGYPPSVFSLLPQFLERAGTAETGAITGIYTVLVEGDDFSEPVADAARGLLDGHIVLSRELAAHNHYPPIDVLRSVSRLMPRIAAAEHQDQARRARQILAGFAQIEDALNLGTYAPGTDPQKDNLIRDRASVMSYLCQMATEKTTFDETIARLGEVVRTRSPGKPVRKAPKAKTRLN